jgi:uncharacterized glyoxalase superfamily metalloenzyme YdcJ
LSKLTVPRSRGRILRVALTPKGRALYDRLLDVARQDVRPAPDGSNAAEYQKALEAAFRNFPDDWDTIRREKLGYFTYRVADRSCVGDIPVSEATLDRLVEAGAVACSPVIYEDFLPVSAAGIFQSNLGDDPAQEFVRSPNQRLFEEALGAQVLNEFEHYAAIEAASIKRCLAQLEAVAA